MYRSAHIGIDVKDLTASERFYRDVLTCKKKGSIVTDSVLIDFMDFANGTFELVQHLDGVDAVRHSPNAHLAFEVADIDAEYARISSLGVEMIDKIPRAFSGGRLFFFKGPDGESIEFCSGIRMDPVALARP